MIQQQKGPGPRLSRWTRRTWVWVGVASLLVTGAAGSLGIVRAGGKGEGLQEALPPGVVRLSLARLHARTLALHHNEFQARGRYLTYFYLPEVTTEGVRGRAWVAAADAERSAASIEAEVRALAEAIVSEARLAAGVEYDVSEDVRFEIAVEGKDEPWIFAANRLQR